MAVRLAASGDLAQLKTLYLAGPHLADDMKVSEFIASRTISVVNTSGSSITACVVADRDDSIRDKIIVYRLVFGQLLPIRTLLKEIVTRAKPLGYTKWIGHIPQHDLHPEFDTFRAYVEARWPYVESYDGSGFRYAADTLDAVTAVA